MGGVAGRPGFEPGTYGLRARRSARLSYRPTSRVYGLNQAGFIKIRWVPRYTAMALVVVEALMPRLRRFVVELAYEAFGEEGYWVEVGLSWSRRWARTLVLLEDGEPIGFNQVYAWPCCGTILGVHHYVAVRGDRRGRGYGKVLVAAGEEVLDEMGGKVYAATLRASNMASRRMLEEMGYRVMAWSEAEEELGAVCVDELMYVTGGYTDDLVALKPGGCPPRSLREALRC